MLQPSSLTDIYSIFWENVHFFLHFQNYFAPSSCNKLLFMHVDFSFTKLNKNRKKKEQKMSTQKLIGVISMLPTTTD